MSEVSWKEPVLQCTPTYSEDDNSTPLPHWKNTDYNTLQQSEFRLLYLHGFRNSIFQCSLRQVSLEECFVEYIALSYRWETGTLPQTIELEGRALEITGNLFQALKQLHKIDQRPVWVDAICINQEDDVEKARQIGRMMDIYSKASWTGIWLGEDADGSQTVMEMLSQNPRTHHKAMHAIKTAVHESSPNDPVVLFFQRSYWSRTWIIQEIALSRDPYLLCGNGPRVNWEYFETTVFRVWSSSSNPSGWLHDIHNLISVRSDELAAGRVTGILQVILRTRTSLATILRDKVYGLIGLAADNNYFVRNPDYSRLDNGTFRIPDDDICIGMFETFVRSTRSLDLILLGSALEKDSRSLPSWCPDFLHAARDPFSSELADYVTDSTARITAFFAGRRSTTWRTTQESLVANVSTLLSCAEEKYLTARGLHIGVVHSLGASSIESNDKFMPQSLPAIVRFEDLNSHITPHSLFRLLLLRCHDYELCEENRMVISSFFNRLYNLPNVGNWNFWVNQNLQMDVFGKTIGDILKDGWSWDFDRKAAKDHGIDLESIPPSSMEEASLLTGEEIKTRREKTATALVSDEMIRLHLQEGLYTITKEELRLITVCTSNDCWIGLGHAEVKPGDHVYLLEGCSLPVILRATNGSNEPMVTNDWEILISRQHQVVGHAYIDGMMNGEVWNERKNELYSIPVF
jgi:Heterokaryon incompatibility protein (HET)